MSDEFTFSLPCLPGSSSSDFERGGFTWKAGVLCAAYGQTFLTLSCQPTENKETLLWRCDANVVIDLSPGIDTNRVCNQWPVFFNSHMKCSKLKTKLRTHDVRIEIKVVRSFIIDLSSPTNALISKPSDAARFEIAGRVVHLSKNMLTRCSPFFDAMFNGDFLEKTTGAYALREVDFLEVMHLMAIVHRKTAFIDASSVGYLATLADMYDVRQVAELCREFLRFHKKENVENREILSERCDHFRQEGTVIETKEILVSYETLGPDVMRAEGELEIGAFHCRLKLFRYSNDLRSTGDLTYGDLVVMSLSPLKNNRSVLWRCVTRSSAPSDADVVGNDVVEKQHVFSSFYYTRRYRSMTSASTGNQNDNFCMKLVESDFIDLSSPENEFIKDPEDAVCLEVDGAKLWFSKTVLTLSCASFCDLFKEARDFYVIDDVDFTQFLHFMAILHSYKFLGRLRPEADLLRMADRFRCAYMTDRVGYPEWCG